MQEHTDYAALVSPTFKLQKRTFSAKLPEGKNDVTAIQMYGLYDINFTSVLFLLQKAKPISLDTSFKLLQDQEQRYKVGTYC